MFVLFPVHQKWEHEADRKGWKRIDDSFYGYDDRTKLFGATSRVADHAGLSLALGVGGVVW